MSLDQQLKDIVTQRDLTSVSIGFIRMGDEWLTNVSAQGGGECATGGLIDQGLKDALEGALTELAARRSDRAVIEELEEV